MQNQLVVPRNKTGAQIFPFLLGMLAVCVLASCVSVGDSAEPSPTAMADADVARITEGKAFTLDARASSPASETTIQSYFWEQIGIDNGPRAIVLNANTDEASVTAPLVPGTLELEFRLTVTGSNSATASDTVRVTVVPSDNRDADGDGLIEIDSLEMLHNMRYNLAGTSYKAGASDTGDASGCPPAGCTGYELSTNLDFDANGNGSTWTGNSATGFTLDTGDNNDTYFDIARDGTGGWLTIGSEANPFAATFEGNGYTISNLAIKRDERLLGFFGFIDTASNIRNIGLRNNLADYSGRSNGLISVGGLVGLSHGSITASYTTGSADGGDGGFDFVAGLVGFQWGGSITASYATGTANGGAGNADRVGGLVGNLDGGGSIAASYATAHADDGNGDNDSVGELVGLQENGSIAASYTTDTGLTATNAGSEWNNAANNSAGAWDFGTASQAPVLKYADYDGPDGDVYSCDPQGGRGTVPAGLCDTIIPGQGR